MTGILILGFFAIFVFSLAKNVQSFAKYRPLGIRGSQLNQYTAIALATRASAMESINGVDEWKAFDILDQYPDFPASRARGHQFIGSLQFTGEHGPTHVFDWQFAVAQQQGWSTSWFQTVVWFELDDRRIPNFNLRPCDLPIDASIPGYQPTSIAGLHSEYRLDSPSTSSIHRLFESATMQHDLNAVLLGDKWHIDRYDNTLTVSVFNKLWEPNEIPMLIEHAERIVSLLLCAGGDADQALQDRIAAFRPTLMKNRST